MSKRLPGASRGQPRPTRRASSTASAKSKPRFPERLGVLIWAAGVRAASGGRRRPAAGAAWCMRAARARRGDGMGKQKAKPKSRGAKGKTVGELALYGYDGKDLSRGKDGC